MKVTSLLIVLLMFAVPAFAQQDNTKPEKTVTIDAKDQPVADVIAKMSEQSGSKILAEKLVTGNVTVSIQSQAIEKALGLFAKAAGSEWMKVYVPSTSVYAKDADALAAQVRLLLGLKFPDVVIAPSASYSPLVHLQTDATTKDLVGKIGTGTGLEPVYLITNDKAYTKKQAKNDDKSKTKKYTDLNKELMEMFMSMTPEERAEAMKQGMQMTTQLGPEAMMELMNTVMQMDPQYMNDMNSKAMQAIMNMDATARRNFLKNSMRSQFNMMKNMNTEQMQQFQKETQDIVKELIESGEIQMPAPGMPNP